MLYMPSYLCTSHLHLCLLANSYFKVAVATVWIVFSAQFNEYGPIVIKLSVYSTLMQVMLLYQRAHPLTAKQLEN